MLFARTALTPGPLTGQLEGFKLLDVPLEGERGYARYAFSQAGFALALSGIRTSIAQQQELLTSHLNDYRFSVVVGISFDNTIAPGLIPWTMDWAGFFASAVLGALRNRLPQVHAWEMQHICGRTLSVTHETMRVEIGTLPDYCLIRWQDRDFARLLDFLENLLFPALLAYVTAVDSSHGTAVEQVQTVPATHGANRTVFPSPRIRTVA